MNYALEVFSLVISMQNRGFSKFEFSSLELEALCKKNMCIVDFITVLTSNLDSAPPKTPSLVYHMSHLDEK